MHLHYQYIYHVKEYILVTGKLILVFGKIDQYPSSTDTGKIQYVMTKEQQKVLVFWKNIFGNIKTFFGNII